MVFPLDKAVLAALFAECIMYGMCMAMGAVTTLVFLRARAEGGFTHKRLLFALLLMLLFATTHVIISLVRAFEGFILYRDRFPGGPSEFFANIGDRVFIAKMGVFIMQTVLGDSVNIWRCYIVFGKKKTMIILPLLVMIAGFVCACMILGTQEHASMNSTVFGPPSRWIKSFHILMLVTVLYCNFAIAWRIYLTRNFTTCLSNLLPVLLAIVETGVIYTSSLLAFLAAYFSQSNGQYVAVDLITPLVPIVFCLLILQVNFNRASEPSHELSTIIPPLSIADSPRWLSVWGSVQRGLGLTGEQSSIVISHLSSAAVQIPAEGEGRLQVGISVGAGERSTSTEKYHSNKSVEDNSIF